MSSNKLLKEKLKIINLGIESFHQTALAHGAKSLHVDWKPPLVFDKKLQELLEKNRSKIEAANLKALAIVNRGRPMLIGLAQAGEVIPGMKKNLILHAGPPIEWARMCGPMRGAIIGALLYEGLAHNEEDAASLAASSQVEYSPCHEHQTVGPMAGVVSFSMPVFILENSEYKNPSGQCLCGLIYQPLNQ